MTLKGHIMKLKNGDIDCCIPCRNLGDFDLKFKLFELIDKISRT